MIDVQNDIDERGLPIQKVGVKDIRYPITILDRKNKFQSTVAQVSMSVDLPHCARGTHMSRFVESLNNFREEIGPGNLKFMLQDLIERLDSESAHIEVRFPYFIEKEAPVSKLKGYMDYECAFIASHSRSSFEPESILEVNVPVTSLCPCSKAISSRGAHNQRSLVKIQINCAEFVWIEELIEIAETASSAAIYSLLKREDEKYVTEQAYDNPVFVEDLVRNVARPLIADQRIPWFKVESENFESIHNHSAFATIEWTQDG